jgi:hypothetical protein
MSDGNALSGFFYGAIGGGSVAFAFRFVENYLIAPRFSESLEARNKLFIYAKPLWLACHELEFRLTMISDKLSSREQGGPRTSLSFSLASAQSIDWFTKDGYYITSSAYLISAVSCWIQLYERDVVFLRFGRSSLTKKFFDLVQEFKIRLSSHSILWFHYVNGIGEELTDKTGNRPITLSEFTKRLYQDELFKGYYDQLFIFLNEVAKEKYLDNIDAASKVLRDIKCFLEENRVTIRMNQQSNLSQKQINKHYKA